MTTSYQFGAEHQFSQNVAMDVTGFYKDIFGLLATEEYDRGPTEGASTRTSTRTTRRCSGVEFKLTKRFSNYFSGNMTYTWLQATGVSSDANQGAQAEADGSAASAAEGDPARLGRAPHGHGLPVRERPGQLGGDVRLQLRQRHSVHADVRRPEGDRSRDDQLGTSAVASDPEPERDQEVQALRTGVQALLRGC